jgi:hypothetical protein
MAYTSNCRAGSWLLLPDAHLPRLLTASSYREKMSRRCRVCRAGQRVPMWTAAASVRRAQLMRVRDLGGRRKWTVQCMLDDMLFNSFLTCLHTCFLQQLPWQGPLAGRNPLT